MDILIIQVLNSIFYAAVLFLIAAGLSLFTGISWLAVIERVGAWAEAAYEFLMRKIQEQHESIR